MFREEPPKLPDYKESLFFGQREPQGLWNPLKKVIASGNRRRKGPSPEDDSGHNGAFAGDFGATMVISCPSFRHLYQVAHAHALSLIHI